MDDVEILESYYEIIIYDNVKNGWTTEFVDTSLLGMKFDYDIKTIRDKVVFPKETRINAKLLKQAKENGVKTLLFPDEAILNQYSAIE